MTEPAPGTSDTPPAPPAAPPANPGLVADPSSGGGGQPPAGYVEQARYDGAMRTLSQRDNDLKKVKADLEALQAKLKESQTTLGAKEADLGTQIAQLTKTVEALTGEKGTLEKDLSGAKSLLTKYEALKAFPELLPMADSIPALSDPAAMEAHLKVVKAGVDQVAQDLAKKMTAGLTPGTNTPPAGGQPGAKQFAFSTVNDWMKAMDEALADTKDPSKFATLETQYLAWLAAGGPS